MRRPPARLLLHLHHMDRVPAAPDLLRPVPRLLDEDDAGEALVEVPKVHGGDAALEVHLAVLVERLQGEREKEFRVKTYRFTNSQKFSRLI